MLSVTDWQMAVRQLRLASTGVLLADLVLLTSLTTAAASAARGVADEPCPPSAIAVEPGSSIQDAVDHASEGSWFCLKNGVHRLQIIRPKRGQAFHGEGATVLNGSRLLKNFIHDGRYWVASGQTQRSKKHGKCRVETPGCDQPERVFIDDQPLARVLTRDEVGPGHFYLDYASQRLYLGNDPAGHKVEATAIPFAFNSTAANVLIRNITVEKYSSPAQKGAIQGRAPGWAIENCEVRLNSGEGIEIGTNGRIHGCNVHHNGQVGVGGLGRNILIQYNGIWANNTNGFDFEWEAGGVKVVLSDHVTFRGNYIHDNVGPGLWCDIHCRDVLVEENLVEQNYSAGIFYEISFNAVIRNNVLRHNATAERTWFWGNDIRIAASQGVEVVGNRVTVGAGGCGIVLVDQSRNKKDGSKYLTRDNRVHHNELTFEGAPCAGGVSDAQPGDQNYNIIAEGNNRFDRNVYNVLDSSGQPRFVWGHDVYDWEGLRRRGVEPNGRLIVY